MLQSDISGLVAIENKYLSDQKQNHREFVYFTGIATNGDRCNQQKGQGPYTRDASYRNVLVISRHMKLIFLIIYSERKKVKS